jgi:hypothetical protein
MTSNITTIDVSALSKESRLSFHGSVSSCVGPVLDVSMNSKLFVQQRYTAECFKLDIFLPSVYDALFIIRSSLNLRDGTVVKCPYIGQYLSSVPFNDSYLLSLVHLVPADYSLITADHSFYFTEISQEILDTNARDVLLGLASLFFIVKSYSNSLVAELSQLCYASVLRSVALGSTDGLCTWMCACLLGLQPVLVPAGRISLGRIFNVVGAVIDRYLELSLSSQFNTFLSVENYSLDSSTSTQYKCIESCGSYSYALCYQNPVIDCPESVANNLDFKLFDQHHMTFNVNF